MSEEKLIRHIEAGAERGELTASHSWWDEYRELKGERLHGRDLFEQTTLQARATDEEGDGTLPGITEVVIRLRVNTGTYGTAEGIMEEVGESLGWLAYDHDAILDGIWRVEEDA